ncbi:hypothetical protein [Streptomyces sp. 8L]|uniref:hypothetical protein n=1 Tax=Streptomyces sp. 8L TaxID=2877242 RepID=UPI001CD47974|nr:hypothetical protein [Streptomyces sp. 8L]MCA1221406.1 hypothetical protein [Streptomyces sp. 8L]
MSPKHLNLREGEPRLVVCPDCESWCGLERSMIKPHRDGTEAPTRARRYVGDKPSRGRRCPGSAQRIVFDVTSEQWGERLLEAETTASARRSTMVLPKVKAAPAPAVSQLVPAPLSAETIRRALRGHIQQCRACKGKATSRVGEPLPCRDGERLAVTFLRLLRQEPKRRAVRDLFARERRRFDRQYAAAAPARRAFEWGAVLPAVQAVDSERAQLPTGDTPTEAPSVPLDTLRPSR